MISTAIVGATGYTGSELVRLLVNHPEVDLKCITSESRTNDRFSDVHPQFTGIVDMPLMSAEQLKDKDLDVVFLALPHGVSMQFAKQLEGTGIRIIDLSGDFRLSSSSVYWNWYQKEHTYEAGFEKAVYGLPELHRSAIEKADLVANPGCYPTSVILGLAPLIAAQWLNVKEIIADSKSGVTGAGVKAKPGTHYSNVSDNFKSYGLKSHRHTIEIEEQLTGLQGEGIQIQFTPHLLPVDRGILSTIYSRPRQPVNDQELQKKYEDFYREHPFVRIRKQPPNLKEVRGTNFCDLYVTYDDRTNRIITIAVIDNLVKGAAGQAVQNMNIMFGLDEQSGLNLVPLYP